MITTVSNIKWAVILDFRTGEVHMHQYPGIIDDDALEDQLFVSGPYDHANCNVMYVDNLVVKINPELK